MECSLADHSAALQRFVDRHLGSASRAERHQPSSAVAGARWVPHSHRSTIRWIPTGQEVIHRIARSPNIRSNPVYGSARGGTRTRKPFRTMPFEGIEFARFLHSGLMACRSVAEMRTRREVDQVLALRAEGLNGCEIARRTGIPRGTVKGWLTGHAPDFDGPVKAHGPRRTCPVCRGDPTALPQTAYTYLLGLYLGDGCLSMHPREVYKLRIVCANAYPELMRRCELAMAEVLPNKVGRAAKIGCTEVASYSTHWICLFPQHGPGRKHERKIELTAWQQELIDRDPRPLLEGLLHSDGCRVQNWVNGTPYPRYHFTNWSADILAIFGRACDALGIEWRPHNRVSLSVARRASVALLDEFVGSKR